MRSAHYWGHRGNQIVGKLENVFENLENLSINNDWQNDCNNGIRYYTLASMLRAVSLKLSLPNEYEEENLASLFTPENIPYFPDWLRSWSQNIQIGKTTNFEKLSSLAQGIGDIAHQYRGIAGIEFRRYRASVLFNVRDNLDIEQINRIFTACNRLWETAKQLRETDENIIKYYHWTANLEILQRLITQHYNGEQLTDLATLESELEQKSNNLQQESGIVYNVAKSICLQELRKLYEVLNSDT